MTDKNIIGMGALATRVAKLEQELQAAYRSIRILENNARKAHKGNEGRIATLETSHIGNINKLYYATSITLSAGTSADTVADLRYLDGTTYDLAEASATPGFNLVVSFYNVTYFDRVLIWAAYEGSASHSVLLQVYNWVTAAYVTLGALPLAALPTSQTHECINLPFARGSLNPYMGTGAYTNAAAVRFYHESAGNASHDLHIDAVMLAE